MHRIIRATLTDARQALDDFCADDGNIERVAMGGRLLVDTLRNGNSIYSCGNGGSMSDAMHFAEELTGRYRDNRAALSATAISDPGHLSCVANDFGYEHVFARYLAARGRPGDCLLAISTSGNRPMMVDWASPPDSRLGKLADVDIAVGPSAYADRIQELHIKVIHLLIELIERDFFPENYRS